MLVNLGAVEMISVNRHVGIRGIKVRDFLDQSALDWMVATTHLLGSPPIRFPFLHHRFVILLPPPVRTSWFNLASCLALGKFLQRHCIPYAVRLHVSNSAYTYQPRSRRASPQPGASSSSGP